MSNTRNCDNPNELDGQGVDEENDETIDCSGEIEEYEDEMDCYDNGEDGFEIDCLEQFELPFYTDFTAHELAQLTFEMKSDMERITPQNEYLGSEQRPPPFQYDNDHPPLPLQKDQLQRGDIVCVFHPEDSFWRVNYMFVQFHEKQKNLEFSSLDPRLSDEHKKLFIPYENSWPVIYRYTKALKEKAKTPEPTLSEQKLDENSLSTSKKLPILEKNLISISWEGYDASICETLHLYWKANKNSFLRCLSLAAKRIQETWSYENLTLISGAGTYFRWKETFGNKYHELGDIDEEIQLIEKVSSLKIDQVWIDEWKNLQDNKTPTSEDVLKQELIYSLETRTVKSLKNNSFVLSHDDNGNFGILCGYRALEDINSDINFLEKPAKYVFLLKKFVVNEDFALKNESNTWDYVSIAGLKYVVFVSKSISDSTIEKKVPEAKISSTLLKETLECAIKLYHNKDENKPITSKSVTLSQKETTNIVSNDKKSSKCETSNTNTTIDENTKEEQQINTESQSYDSEDSDFDQTTEMINPEVEGLSGFKRLMYRLKEPANDVMCQKILYCLMIFHDARIAVRSCFDRIKKEFEMKDSKSSPEKLLIEPLEKAIKILDSQTDAISNEQECKNMNESFDGNLKSIAPKNTKLKENLYRVVEKLSQFEKELVGCYEEIVALIP